MLPSVMNRSFSKIPAPQIQRSVFNRTHGHKTTFNAGYLIPFFVDEILPGDTMSLNAQIFARLSTLIFPIMDNVFLDTFYFFVPNRLVWNNWEKFQGAQDDPGDSTDFELPVVTDGESLTVTSNSLLDYFGIPVGVEMDASESPMALATRAYNLIWNEWFRDQNLQDSVVVDLDDGPDSISDYVLLRRGKRHDYFTSCLPYPQRGDAVAIPLGGSAPITGIIPVAGNGTLGLFLNNGDSGYRIGTANGQNYLAVDPAGTPGNIGDALTVAGGSADKIAGFSSDPAETGLRGSMAFTGATLAADLSAATAATVNQLREAFAVQQILETDARGGTRYVEHLRAHWGVVSPDFRLQRPEYLGGSSQRVDVRGVAQTSSTDATTPQGNLASYAQVGNRSGFYKSFVEHGLIIGLVNVRADLTYQQGMRRMWSRQTRFDFYMPELAHLGEQVVYNREIWLTANNPAVNAGVFGYQERWAEYRYFPSLVTGLFRSDAAGSLDNWHLSTDFAALPVLNSSFIQDDPPMDRVIAVNNEPHVLMDSFIEIKHARPMPVYSIPGLQRL